MTRVLRQLAHAAALKIRAAFRETDPECRAPLSDAERFSGRDSTYPASPSAVYPLGGYGPTSFF